MDTNKISQFKEIRKVIAIDAAKTEYQEYQKLNGLLPTPKIDITDGMLIELRDQ